MQDHVRSINATASASAVQHPQAVIQSTAQEDDWQPIYSRWRHGGWYVHNVRRPGGACGCVSNNYPDEKWRIVCDHRRRDLGGPGDHTYPTRDAAARAELALVNAMHPPK